MKARWRASVERRRRGKKKKVRVVLEPKEEGSRETMKGTRGEKRTRKGEKERRETGRKRGEISERKTAKRVEGRRRQQRNLLP